MLADTFAEPEAGRRIYEAAISVAPNQAFLYQQWALFELHHPRGSLDEAERRANEAHGIDNKNTAVIHTQAEIDRIRARKVKSALLKDQLRRRARERLDKLGNSRFAASSRCKLLVDELAELNRQLTDDAPEHEAIFFAEKAREAEKIAFASLSNIFLTMLTSFRSRRAFGRNSIRRSERFGRWKRR